MRKYSEIKTLTILFECSQTKTLTILLAPPPNLLCLWYHHPVSPQSFVTTWCHHLNLYSSTKPSTHYLTFLPTFSQNVSILSDWFLNAQKFSFLTSDWMLTNRRQIIIWVNHCLTYCQNSLTFTHNLIPSLSDWLPKYSQIDIFTIWLTATMLTNYWLLKWS